MLAAAFFVTASACRSEFSLRAPSFARTTTRYLAKVTNILYNILQLYTRRTHKTRKCLLRSHSSHAKDPLGISESSGDSVSG